MENKITKINEFIDNHARIIVGRMLKRIEILQEHSVLTPELYKSLIREIQYEETRNLKSVLEVYLTVGKITFEKKQSN